MTYIAVSRRVLPAAVLALIGSALLMSAPTNAATAPVKTVSASSTQTVQIPTRGVADPGLVALAVPDGHGIIADVDVTLASLDHRCPEDLDVVLVGPSGQGATLMFDAGRCAAWPPRLSEPYEKILTFDDEADAELSNREVPISGQRYRPTDVSGATHAPARLDVFDGLAASGTWQLIISDMRFGDEGTLTGWSLDIDYTDTVAPVGGVSVGGDAARTRSSATTLTLSAADVNPGTGVTQMRLSNDGVTWSPLRPFAATASWSLSPGDGTKTVYVQYADDFGNLSVPASDTIVLDTTAPTASQRSPNKEGTHAATKVTFLASESLDPSTLNRRNVRLTAGGATLHAKVTYAPATRKVTLTPQRRLATDTTYKVKISRRVTDLAGNGFASTPWSFRTT